MQTVRAARSRWINARWGCLLITPAMCSALLSAQTVKATTIVRYEVDTFAEVSDPMRLTMDSAGNLYAGRNNLGSGGMSTDAVSIHKISPEGGVTSFGEPLAFPFGVLYDGAGAVGPAGSVLVSEWVGAFQFRLRAIQPDGSTILVAGEDQPIAPLSDLVFDRTGRLLFVSWQPFGVMKVGPDGDAPLYDLPSPGVHIAVDGGNRLFTSSEDGVIRVHDAEGSLIDASFASGLSDHVSLAFGPGGAWGNGLYAVSDGALLRFDDLGESEPILSALTTGQSSDLLFAPDGSLLVSDTAGDRIVRVRPVVLGGLNGDGVFDAFDVAPFEMALTRISEYVAVYPGLDPIERGDFDGNGFLDAFDVAGFEAALAGLALSVPEPSALLCLMGLAGLMRRRRTRSR